MKLFRRENYLRKIRSFYHADDLIKVITGVRRCGKSCLMQMIADELREQGISEDQIVFLDLDRRGYRKIRTPAALEKLIEEQNRTKKLKYLFIDEIQNVTDFEEILNGFRTDGEWSIFITGSNSYLLSGELITKLTGRYLEFELFPLSFEEYEGMKAFYEKPIDPNPLAELNSFILEGGFPRAVLLDGMQEKRTYVQGIVREIFESPKTEAAKRLIIGSGSKGVERMTGRRTIRIVFDGQSSYEPVIGNVTLAFGTPVNIMYAATRDIGGSAAGEMILQLPEDREIGDRMITYLRERKVIVEELEEELLVETEE